MGYGIIWLPSGHDHLILAAHRASWIFNKGEIPDGLGVLHHCDNPPCTNPDHLFVGTEADNAFDRDRKNRRNALKGEAHGMAFLSEDDIRSIRTDVSIGIKKRHIEKEYGLSSGYAKKIADKIVWKHVN